MNSTKKIFVPQIDTVPEWAEFLVTNKLISTSPKPENVLIDFGSVEEIMPYHLVSLACLIEEYWSSGVKILFKKNENQTQQYLRKIDFFKYWKGDFDRSSYHEISQNTTTLCLWKIDYEMISTYSIQAKQYFEANYIKDKNLDPLYISLSEVFNNIYDHSDSKVTGYALTEYFQPKEQFVISVCDFGVGIPQKINEYLISIGEDKLSPNDALKKALEIGFSTKTKAHNRGFGLDNVLSQIEALQGEILIISNNVYYRKEAKQEPIVKLMNVSYPGTNIVIYLNASKLEHIEEQDRQETKLF